MSTDHPSNSPEDDQNPSMFDSLKEHAGAQAHQLADDVKEQAARREQGMRNNMSRRADEFATALRSANSGVDSDSVVTDMIDYAADNISGIANSLNRTSTGEMVDNIRNFARERPGTFMGLSALAGFAATRFLLSSSRGDSGHTGDWRDWPGGNPSGTTAYSPGAAHPDAGGSVGATAGDRPGAGRARGTSDHGSTGFSPTDGADRGSGTSTGGRND